MKNFIGALVLSLALVLPGLSFSEVVVNDWPEQPDVARVLDFDGMTCSDDNHVMVWTTQDGEVEGAGTIRVVYANEKDKFAEFVLSEDGTQILEIYARVDGQIKKFSNVKEFESVVGSNPCELSAANL